MLSPRGRRATRSSRLGSAALTGAALAGAAALAGCGPAHHRAAAPAPAAPAPAPTAPVPTTTVPVTAPPTTAAPAPPTTVARPATTVAPPAATVPAATVPATVAARVPATVPAATWAPTVEAAMRTFTPTPGLEAPRTVPPVPEALSAQATDLGGTDTVDLVATPTALPVNDPALQAGGGTDVGTWSSTPTSSASATAEVTGAESSTLDPCTGAATAIAIAGAPGATTCLTAMGQAVDWTSGAWVVQVLSGAPGAAPAALASQLGGWTTAHQLPPATAGLITATTGGATTLRWAGPAGVYQTRSALTPTTAADLAGAMQPWPG